MPIGRKRGPLMLPAEDRARLEMIRRSRTEQRRRTVRAAILLDAADGMTDQANALARQVNRNTVVLCVRKYLGFGLEAALGELPIGQAQTSFRRGHCLDTESGVPEAEGSGLCPGVVDVSVIDCTCAS